MTWPKRKYNKEEVVLPTKEKPCDCHNPKNKELGYLAWHQWAETMTKQRKKQLQCPECGYWFFKCEL